MKNQENSFGKKHCTWTAKFKVIMADSNEYFGTGARFSTCNEPKHAINLDESIKYLAEITQTEVQYVKEYFICLSLAELPMLSKSQGITGISWSRREGVHYTMEQFTPRGTRKTVLHDHFLRFHK